MRSGQQFALEPVLAAAYRQLVLHFDDYVERWERDWAAALAGVPYSLIFWLRDGACTARHLRGVFEVVWRWRLANRDCQEEGWDDICRSVSFQHMALGEIRDILDDPAMGKDAVLLRRLGMSVLNTTVKLTPRLVAVDAAGYFDAALVVPPRNTEVLLPNREVLPFGTRHFWPNDKIIKASWCWCVGVQSRTCVSADLLCLRSS